MKIFITGGTTGIGWSLAKAYLEEAHTVGICGRHLDKVPQEARKGGEEAGAYGDRLKCYEVDVRDREKLQKTIREFAQGDIDMVVANAGISGYTKSPSVDFDLARKTMDINLGGVMHAFEVAQELMVPKKRGHMVAVASVAGMVGLPRAGAYCASKAAVLKLCESMAIDLAPYGISVSAIAPGFVNTPLNRNGNIPFMPWIMPADKAAKKIKHSLERKRRLFTFPWQMKMAICVLEKMPRGLYHHLARLFFSLAICCGLLTTSGCLSSPPPSLSTSFGLL